MSNYGDYFVPGLFFVTSAAIRREPVLAEAPTVHLLRTVLNRVKQRHPFRTLGYVFLPDHMHLLVAPGPGVTLDQVMHGVVRRFSREYLTLLGQPGGQPVWQVGYDKRNVDTVDAFAAYLDYVHYDPVRHGRAARPEEWLHSSYEAWVERGLYDLGWGWSEPKRIRGTNWG